MHRIYNFLLAGLLFALIPLTVPLSQLRGQSPPEPAVVISLADFSHQLKDVDYLVEASGFGQMKFAAQTLIKQYAKGINAKVPAGVLLYFREDSDTPDFLGFVPVSNLDEMLDTIAGVAEVDEGDDFTKIVTDDGTELLLKQVGDHAFLSNKKETFENLPSDPDSLLGDLPSKYNLSAQLFGQRIPKNLREKAVTAIRDSYEKELDRLDEDGKLSTDLQKKNFDLQMKQIELWINETDKITVGMSADKEAQALYTDVLITALPNSSFAKRMAASVATEPSRFNGFFLDGAAATQHTHASVSSQDLEQYEQSMTQLKDALKEGLKDQEDFTEDEIALAEKSANNLLDVIMETLKAGKLDSGAVLMLEEGNPNFAFGMLVAEPKKLEETLKEVLAYAETRLGDGIQVELNSGNHKSVTFHQVVIPISDDEDEARKILGDEVTLVIGIGKDDVYLAAGSNPLPLLKQAMDAKGPELVAGAADTIMQYNIYLAPILKFAGTLEGSEPLVAKMAEELATNAKDRVRIDSKIIENGMSMRFEMQDGILALIKVAMDNFGAGGFPGGDNDF